MDFLRSRRGDPPSRGQEPDLEQQSHRPDMQEQRGQELQSRRGRPILRSLFTRDADLRRGGGGGEGQRPDDTESPKSPPPPPQPQPRSTPGNRIRLPSLARPTRRERRGSSPRRRGRHHDHRSSDGDSDQRPEPEPAAGSEAAAVAVARPERSHRTEDAGRRRFRGTDPAESQLADLAEDGRRRRHHHHHHHRHRREGGGGGGGSDDGDGGSRTTHRDRPSRFLFCFPWIESRRMRSQVLRCFVSGMFLMLMLSIYLALSLTKNINSSEFTILVILVILATTIFFCHGLVRLCLMVLRPRSDDDDEQRRGADAADSRGGPLPQYYGPGGYAIPRRPIRVVLARDEEAAGILDSEAAKLQPPAYGLWRESVRVDPDRIYWQRNEQAQPEDDNDDDASSSNGGTRTSREGGDAGAGAGGGADRPRPPSYASDDGVEYVVEARPRSIAPTALSSMSMSMHHQVQTPTSSSSVVSEWPSGRRSP
ncbi:hypothetical protein F5X96DRAFT_34032 [Biscogniauxia mediterranea]|nr:hypothetical protein F5X96DRAFT_34032 [Biscogniauxia mediterranea]